jgi:hypothetical protein
MILFAMQFVYFISYYEPSKGTSISKCFLDMSKAIMSMVVGSSKKNNTYIYELTRSGSNDIFSFYKNGMEGEVLCSRPTECVCNLPMK